VRAGRIVDAGLLSSLSAFFPSLGTVQTLTGTRAATGQTIPNPTNLAEHVDLACRMSPLRANEMPGMITVTTNALYATLAGYYPAITTAMQFVVSGVAYNIRAVEHDGTHTIPRLVVERVTA
jgi:hypothetical protein